MRVGFGYDVHQLKTGRKLILGGVDIPHNKGLTGHSDADVLIHAVVDALLGAAGMGDIGMHFDDTDEKHKDADSRVFLRRVNAMIMEQGLAVSNIDITVVAEAPKISPYAQQMKHNLAADLGVDKQQLNIKATKNETMGFIGRQEGIAAYAIVALTDRKIS